MKKLIAVALLVVVVISAARSLFGNLFYETGNMIERRDFKGSLDQYILYCYWTPVVKEKCEYGLDGSCNRHDSRSECTSQWDDSTLTEKKAMIGTIVFNFILLLIVWKFWLRQKFSE